MVLEAMASDDVPVILRAAGQHQTLDNVPDSLLALTQNDSQLSAAAAA